MAQIINGKALAEKIRNELTSQVAEFKKATELTPGLAVVLVGENPASKIYVKNKITSTEQVGMKSFSHFLSENASEKELKSLLEKLNHNPHVHGILVQLPLPRHLDTDNILDGIDPKKDVDGLHPFNLGRLVYGKPNFVPCTPAGVMRMLGEIGFDCSGKDGVVIGRSNIVGKPIALLLLAKNATVTLCHSKTRHLSQKTKSADLVIAAAGVPQLVKGDWIKPGAVVIDVGMNRTAEGKLVGDIDFESVEPVAGYLTPVPGGVGPMTIAMLLCNTLEAARKFLKE